MRWLPRGNVFIWVLVLQHQFVFLKDQGGSGLKGIMRMAPSLVFTFLLISLSRWTISTWSSKDVTPISSKRNQGFYYQTRPKGGQFGKARESVNVWTRSLMTTKSGGATGSKQIERFCGKSFTKFSWISTLKVLQWGWPKVRVWRISWSFPAVKEAFKQLSLRYWVKMLPSKTSKIARKISLLLKWVVFINEISNFLVMKTKK